MRTLHIRLAVPPAILVTLVLASGLMLVAFLIAPETMRPAFIGVVGLMIVLVAFTSVELSLYLLISSTLLSPEWLVNMQLSGAGASRGLTLRVDDFVLTIMCLTWLFRMAVLKSLGIRQTPVNQPIFWYWLATLLATVGGFMSERLGIFGLFFVLKYLEYFVLFYMVINQIHDKASIQRYLIVMLITCFIVSLLGIVQIPGGERVSAPFEGETGEPNTFGGYLVLMFGVVLGILLYEADGAKRWRWLGLLSMIIIPLAFTESRSSYLAFVAMIGLFILLSDRQHKRILIGGCLVGLVLMPFVLPQNVIQRVTFTFSQAEESGQIQVGGLHIDTSTSERLRSWQEALARDFPQHPLLGTGVTGGSFMDAQYPRVLSETGVIGFVLFLWLLRRIWVLLKLGYRNLSDERLKGVAMGTLCAYGGLLFHAIGSNTFIIVRIMEPLMILLGLVMAALLVQRREYESIESTTLSAGS